MIRHAILTTAALVKTARRQAIRERQIVDEDFCDYRFGSFAAAHAVWASACKIMADRTITISWPAHSKAQPGVVIAVVHAWAIRCGSAIGAKRDRHKALLIELDRSSEAKISLTDRDARAMARMMKVGVGYNIQMAVDVQHKLIAEQAVINQVLDMVLLARAADRGSRRSR